MKVEVNPIITYRVNGDGSHTVKIIYDDAAHGIFSSSIHTNEDKFVLENLVSQQYGKRIYHTDVQIGVSGVSKKP